MRASRITRPILTHNDCAESSNYHTSYNKADASAGGSQVNRCIDTTLKGRGAVSKCIPFADMAALVGQVRRFPPARPLVVLYRLVFRPQDVSKLAHWIDFLYQTSTLLVQLAQSSHPDESQALREVMDLVAHHRQPPIAFQPQHNSTLSKSVDTAEDVVRRVMHKVLACLYLCFMHESPDL